MASLLLVTGIGGAVGPGVESLFVAHVGYAAVAIAEGFAVLCGATCIAVATVLPTPSR
jgi:hypothetical protein